MLQAAWRGATSDLRGEVDPWNVALTQHASFCPRPASRRPLGASARDPVSRPLQFVHFHSVTMMRLPLPSHFCCSSHSPGFWFGGDVFSLELSRIRIRRLGKRIDSVRPAYSNMWTISRYLAAPLSAHDGSAVYAPTKQGTRSWWAQ